VSSANRQGLADFLHLTPFISVWNAGCMWFEQICLLPSRLRQPSHPPVHRWLVPSSVVRGAAGGVPLLVKLDVETHLGAAGTEFPKSSDIYVTLDNFSVTIYRLTLFACQWSNLVNTKDHANQASSHCGSMGDVCMIFMIFMIFMLKVQCHGRANPSYSHPYRDP
jgi:hypothetical protein